MLHLPQFGLHWGDVVEMLPLRPWWSLMDGSTRESPGDGVVAWHLLDQQSEKFLWLLSYSGHSIFKKIKSYFSSFNFFENISKHYQWCILQVCELTLQNSFYYGLKNGKIWFFLDLKMFTVHYTQIHNFSFLCNFKYKLF
jgi:hypothetical protein